MSPDITSDVWMGGRPDDWHPTRIKRVCKFSPSSSEGKPSDDELCTVVPMEDVSESGDIAVDDQQLFADVIAGLNLFENGDVLFAKITPCMENGKGALVESLPTRYGFGSTEFHVLRPSHKIVGRYLYYYTFNPTFRAWAEKNMHGAAGQQRVGANFLKYQHLPLPPIDEQKRIADYLDASCEAIDRAVETKQKQLDTLETLRKSVITPAVLRGLNQNCKMKATDNDWLEEIPHHWKLVSLKRISDTQTGVTLGKTYEGELIERPYLRAANVQDGYLDLETITTIEMPEESVSRYELQNGDVLMTEGGDLDKLGRGFLWEEQIEGCLHQNHVFAIRTARNKLLPEFLTYLTTSRFGRDYFEATGKRTTNLASTNSTKVGQLPVPLPPIDEQREIVSHLNARLAQTKSIESAIRKQVMTLVAYRKSLIHECVTGKRRISDANVAEVKSHV